MSERISILLPCAEQKPEYLADAVASVTGQTSARWELLVGLDPQPPAWIPEFFGRFAGDERIRIVHAARPGFAVVLNTLLASATTPFAGILLSDDRWMPDAVATLLHYRRRYPGADFFHSARRYIDAHGTVAGPIMPPRPSFTLDDFKLASPVKHLLCWRREAALAIGGMNEELSRHGCDDYDFPWRMAEAGATFQAIPECLYEYRNHDEGPRLTTSTPLQAQIATIERMFGNHGATEAETCTFLDRAVDSYLPRAFLGRPSNDPGPALPLACGREAAAEAWTRFEDKGFRPREFFPHRVYVLPRAGADGVQLAQRMCGGIDDPGGLREVCLFTLDTAEFPPELFFDDDVVWHRRHLGLPGLVANANLARDDGGRRLYVTQMFSDLVQRISRRREHRSRIENHFAGWAHLLINAIAVYARDTGCDEVFFATAELALAHTDPERTVGTELFERVYDRTLHKRLTVTRTEGWWRAGVQENDTRIASLDRTLEGLPHDGKTICIEHDIERGIGHRGIDDDFADAADRSSPAALEAMLAAEAACGARVTYSVVGMLVPELRAAIERGGHALGFHSYEHVVPATPPLPAAPRGDALRSAMLRLSDRAPALQRMIAELAGGNAVGRRLAAVPARLMRVLQPEASGSQVVDPIRAARDGADFKELLRCRQVDYRVRGYRPPQSRITPGLHDRHLAFFNFEWLASSTFSLGIEEPVLRNGIAKIPIHVDDFDLHRGLVAYEQWEKDVLARVADRPFVAIGLHDCYAEHWLAHYPRLLEKLAAHGRLRTFDEVADFVTLSAARWG